MDWRRYRDGFFSVAACLALWAVACPLPAQAASLRELKQADLLGGKLSYFLLPGVNGLIVKDAQHPESCLIVLKQKGNDGGGDIGEIGKRFIAAFELKGYEAVVAEDDEGTAFLVCEEEEGDTDVGEAAAQALADRKGVMRAVHWLNGVVGAPYSFHGGRLVWHTRAPIYKGGRDTDVEVSIDLARELPCVVDLHVGKAGSSGEEAGISTLLDMDLKPYENKKARAYRKEVGGKVLARQGDAFLLQTAKDSYRLGGHKALLAAHSGTRANIKLPQVACNEWPEVPDSKATASTEPTKPGKGGEQAKPTPAPAGQHTPADARKAYIQRLKAL